MFCQITESNSNAKLILVLVEFWAKIYFEELFDPQKCRTKIMFGETNIGQKYFWGKNYC